MTIEQNKAKTFMTTFDQEVKTTPSIPSSKIRWLRAELILEEALETVRALGFNVKIELDTYKFRLAKNLDCNLIEVADGLADLHYVGYCSTALAFGIDMEPIFAEVHRSNMSKLWLKDEPLRHSR